MRHAVFALFAAPAAIGVACSSFESTNDAIVDVNDAGEAGVEEAAPPAATCDATIATDSKNCGACGHACDANQSCNAGACIAGCADRTIYVATSGDDVNTGCDHKLPKKTIRSAIDFAKTVGATNHEIHVCGGTYVENGLVLDYPIGLRGGYECATFERATTFGWLGFNQTTGHGRLDSTNQTTIQAGTGTTALDVQQPTVTSAIAIEGFTLLGPTAGGGAGLHVHTGAAPVVSANHIVGATAGMMTGISWGSSGVHIENQATPELTHNIIEGGGGGSPTFAGIGSEGVLLQGAAGASQPTGPQIHENEIDSGTGMSTNFATVGIDASPNVTMTGPNALSNNAVFFGGSIASSFYATVGLWIRGGAVNVFGNGFYNSSVVCSGTQSCAAIGVNVYGSGSKIVGNRIAMVGDASGAPNNGPNLLAVVMQGGTSAARNVLFANNLIELENIGKMFTAPLVAISSSADTIHVEANTMVGFSSTIGDGISTTGSNVTIDDNLIVGLRYGVNTVAAQCMAPGGNGANEFPPLAVANNVFADLTGIAFVSSSGATASCGTAASQTYVRAMPFEKDFPIATANLVLSNGCMPAEPNCVACTSANCFTDLFATTPTFTTAVTGTVKLAPTVSCSVAQGGAVTLVTTDITDAKRTTPASVGAVEDDLATCTP